MILKCPNCSHSLVDVSSSFDEIVKGELEPALNAAAMTESEHQASQHVASGVNEATDVEPSVAQDVRGGVLNAADKAEIRNLHLAGHSVPRIRQMMKLNISLDRIYSVVKSKKP